MAAIIYQYKGRTITRPYPRRYVVETEGFRYSFTTLKHAKSYIDTGRLAF